MKAVILTMCLAAALAACGPGKYDGAGKDADFGAGVRAGDVAGR